jgi:four helix bundle protein
MSSRGFKDLRVWQEAYQLTLVVFDMAQELPQEHRYVLAEQLRRAALSGSSNIAEGAGRHTNADFVRFLHIARGSLSELDSQLMVARHVGCCSGTCMAMERAARVGSMINALIRSLSSRPYQHQNR